MDVHADAVQLQLLEASRAGIRASQQVVQNAADGDAPVYGVNTGFGKLANQRISKSQLATLQLNLIRSHCVGVGEPLQPAVMRLMLALKGSHDALWDWDLKHHRLYYSPRWWQMLGYEPDALPVDAQLWRSMTHPQDLPGVEQLLRDFLISQGESFSTECRLKHRRASRRRACGLLACHRNIR